MNLFMALKKALDFENLLINFKSSHLYVLWKIFKIFLKYVMEKWLHQMF